MQERSGGAPAEHRRDPELQADSVVIDRSEQAALYLLCRSGDAVVAMPCDRAREVMRPLAVVELPDAPSYVLGIATIRGLPTLVIDACNLLGHVPSHAQSQPTRFVVLRIPDRSIAIAFEEVLGTGYVSAARLHALPPLAGEARQRLTGIAALDEELYLVLETSRLIPQDVWDRLETLGDKL